MPTDTKDLLAQAQALPVTLAEAGFGTAAGLMGAAAAEFMAAAEAVRVTIHAPFENFLKIWNYVPITLWWKTFAPELFNMFGKPTDIIARELLSGFPQKWFQLPGEISKGLGEASKEMGKDLFDFTILSLALASSPSDGSTPPIAGTVAKNVQTAGP